MQIFNFDKLNSLFCNRSSTYPLSMADIFRATSSFGLFAGTANMASVAANYSKCWLNAALMPITLRFIVGFSTMPLKWNNICAGIDVIPPTCPLAFGWNLRQNQCKWAYLYHVVDSRARTIDFWIKWWATQGIGNSRYVSLQIRLRPMAIAVGRKLPFVPRTDPDLRC